MGRNWAAYLLALGCAALFYSFYMASLSWTVLLAALLLPLFSLLASLPWMIGVRVKLCAPDKVLRGGGAAVELASSGKRPLRLRARVELQDLTGQSRRRRTLRPLAPLGLDTAHCTVIALQVKWVRAYDALGLFWLPVPRPEACRTAVLPAPVWPGEKPVLPRAGEAAPLRPKAGGGLAEEHDVRLYRPGDPVNAIHWKLTAKTDTPMIREPLVEEKQQAVLCLSGSKAREQYDRTLEKLCWLSGALLELSVPHTLVWESGSAVLETPEALEQALYRLLAGPAPGRCRAVPGAGWQARLGEAEP